MIIFVLNAFIDVEAPGHERLMRGPFAAQTAIPLPDIIEWGRAIRDRFTLRRSKPSHHIHFGSGRKRNVGHLTDQRSFSMCPTKPGQTQRMQSTLKIDYEGQILEQKHISCQTVEVDLDTGVRIATATADLKACKFTSSTERKCPHTSFPAGFSNNDRHFVYQLTAKGNNPLVSVSKLSPIQYGGELFVTIRETGDVNVCFQGFATCFPSFEAFVQFPDFTLNLFRVPPSYSVTSLLFGKKKGRLPHSCIPRY